MSSFEALYGSLWHHPGAAWLSAGVMLLVALRRLPFFWAFVLGAIFISAADATITGGLSKLGGESWAAYPVLSFFFVLFGDWRCYLLVARYSADDAAPKPRAWISALRLALLPSLVVFGLGQVFAAAFTIPRVMYLVYELCFIATATTYGALVLSKRLAALDRPDYARWLMRVFGFQLAGYVGWALSDLLILSGQEWAHGLRIIPNVMYYAGFVPVVYLMAPEQELRSLKR